MKSLLRSSQLMALCALAATACTHAPSRTPTAAASLPPSKFAQLDVRQSIAKKLDLRHRIHLYGVKDQTIWDTHALVTLQVFPDDTACAQPNPPLPANGDRLFIQTSPGETGPKTTLTLFRTIPGQRPASTEPTTLIELPPIPLLPDREDPANVRWLTGTDGNYDYFVMLTTNDVCSDKVDKTYRLEVFPHDKNRDPACSNERPDKGGNWSATVPPFMAAHCPAGQTGTGVGSEPGHPHP